MRKAEICEDVRRRVKAKVPVESRFRYVDLDYRDEGAFNAGVFFLERDDLMLFINTWLF